MPVMPAPQLTTESVIEQLMEAAAAGRLCLVRYDNPETAGDEARPRLIQAVRLAQATHDLYCLAWEYAPGNGWRVYRLRYITELRPTPYPALFDSSATFTTDLTIGFHEIDTYRAKRCPFDRRRARSRDAAAFYLDAARIIHARGWLPQPPPALSPPPHRPRRRARPAAEDGAPASRPPLRLPKLSRRAKLVLAAAAGVLCFSAGVAYLAWQL